MYLWRAVDSEGEVLDILVQSRRNKKAALKLMRKLLKKQGYAPNKVVTDKLPSYGAALRDLNMTGKHVTGGRSNNRAENSRWCRKVGGKLENWRKLLIVKHSERRCAAAERSLRHETSYGIDVAQSIFR